MFLNANNIIHKRFSNVKHRVLRIENNPYENDFIELYRLQTTAYLVLKIQSSIIIFS